jgi:hypothetical protein
LEILDVNVLEGLGRHWSTSLAWAASLRSRCRPNLGGKAQGWLTWVVHGEEQGGWGAAFRHRIRRSGIARELLRQVLTSGRGGLYTQEEFRLREQGRGHGDGDGFHGIAAVAGGGDWGEGGPSAEVGRGFVSVD